MKTTLDIPKDLLEEAMRATNSKTKIEAVKKALELAVLQSRRQKLLNYKGRVDFDVDLDVLRDRTKVSTL